MPSSHRHTTGFRRNSSSLGIDYEGDAIATINGSGINVLTGEALTIDSGATLTITGTLSGAGTVTLSSATVTLPTRSAFISLMDNIFAADGAALGITDTAGDIYRKLGTNQMWLQGEEAIMETEASVGLGLFVLPENYVSGGTISFSAYTDVQGAGTLGTCTIDFEAFLQSPVDGSVGSDLVTTAASAVTATGAEDSFVVTPTGLVAGDTLFFRVTTSIEETAGMAIRACITRIGATIQVNK